MFSVQLSLKSVDEQRTLFCDVHIHIIVFDNFWFLLGDRKADISQRLHAAASLE